MARCPRTSRAPRARVGTLPAVIVVQEAFGLNHNIREIAERIAAEGYQAMAPNFYYREGGKAVGYGELPEAIGLMTRWTDAQIVTDVRAAVAALQSDSGVKADRIGMTGFCMGGRVSFLAACEVAGDSRGGTVLRRRHRRPAVHSRRGRAGVSRGQDAGRGPTPLRGERRVHPAVGGRGDPPGLAARRKGLRSPRLQGGRPRLLLPERADYNEEAAKLAWDRTKAFFRKHLQS